MGDGLFGNRPNGNGLMGYGAGVCWAARGRAHIIYVCIRIEKKILYPYTWAMGLMCSRPNEQWGLMDNGASGQ